MAYKAESALKGSIQQIWDYHKGMQIDCADPLCISTVHIHCAHAFCKPVESTMRTLTSQIHFASSPCADSHCADPLCADPLSRSTMQIHCADPLCRSTVQIDCADRLCAKPLCVDPLCRSIVHYAEPLCRSTVQIAAVCKSTVCRSTVCRSTVQIHCV